MPDWTLEIIDCRTGQHRKTGKGAAWRTEAPARRSFEQARALDVNVDTAPFILDLYDSNGDLIDTVGLDAAGFEGLTGYAPKSPDHYTAHDKRYWRNALRARRTHGASLGAP